VSKEPLHVLLSPSWNRTYDLTYDGICWSRPGNYITILCINISPKMAETGRFLLKLQLVFAKNSMITLVFEKKRQFFRRKLAKIAENCDQNNNP
jgi:hypothetical protein